MHGFALNVADRPDDVRPHRAVRHRGPGVTSLAAEGVDVSMARRRRRRRRPRRRRAWGDGLGRAPGRRLAAPGRGPRPRSAGARAPARSSGPRPSRRAARSAAWPQAGVTDGPVHRHPQAGVAAGQGHDGPGVPAAQARRCASSQPRHRLRGRRLPEHLRVLGRRHGHVHDQRRALHPGLRLLPGRHRRSPSPSTPTSPSGWPRPSPAWASQHAVVTAVARDDLADGGAAAFAATIRAIRRRRPSAAVEVLIPDCKGDGRRPRRDLRGPARTC